MPASKRRLMLFDIDGTLITSGGAGEGALMDAMKQRFGIGRTSRASQSRARRTHSSPE